MAEIERERKAALEDYAAAKARAAARRWAASAANKAKIAQIAAPKDDREARAH